MSQEFRLKFDEMQQNNPAEANNAPKSELFASPSHVRNICFIWPDGRYKFLNYAYLISGEFIADLSTIVLSFTNEKVKLKGINLEPLFLELLEHKRKTVKCGIDRYNAISEGQSVVNEITVTE